MTFPGDWLLCSRLGHFKRKAIKRYFWACGNTIPIHAPTLIYCSFRLFFFFFCVLLWAKIHISVWLLFLIIQVFNFFCHHFIICLRKMYMLLCLCFLELSNDTILPNMLHRNTRKKSCISLKIEFLGMILMHGMLW